MNSSHVLAEFCAKLEAASLGYPISSPNRASNPTPPYIETDYLFSEPQRVTINGVHRYRGLFQVTVAIPENLGAVEALRVAESVKALFPCDHQFTAGASLVRVYQTPTVTRGLNDRSAYRVPVTIPFEIIE